ncbi:MAG TPA: glycosyltransferase [Bacteroidales bacterium]|nr:glycosyltransferase [Bacteroidales bacterium]
MISICIPLYHFDARALISELQKQIQHDDLPCDLILIDDYSKEEYRQKYRSIPGNHQYIELPENIGRSKIRNLFLEYSTQPYLLFLDCDSIVQNPDFLKNYISIMETSPEIVCGGRVYPIEKPDLNHLLRWKYGMERESKSCTERKKDPNRSFMTNNFLIKRELLKTIRFDERVTQYGHEDTLFGIALAKRGITITHIENPVLNGDLETNEEFLKKTEAGVNNLLQILMFTQQDPHIMNRITLLQTYQKILWTKPILKPIFKLTNPVLRHFLSKKGSSVTLFNLYKLGLLICS